MYKSWLILLLCCLVAQGRAQTVVRLWENPRADRKQHWSRLTLFLPETEHPRPASPKNQTPPAGKDTLHPALIICPGGSYRYLGTKGEGYEVARWFRDRGVAAFVLHYRIGFFGNHHPAMIQDLQRAIQFVREQAPRLHVDTARVGVMGFSAGGHLAGTAALYGDENFMAPLGIRPEVSLRPSFVAMIYPVVTMREPYVHKKSRRNLLGRRPADSLVHRMSLEENIRQGLPPVFLMAAEDDPTVAVENSRMLAHRLKEKNVPHEVYIFHRGGHGFGLHPKSGSDAEAWVERCWKWINKVINRLKTEPYETPL